MIAIFEIETAATCVVQVNDICQASEVARRRIAHAI